jgi:hypothetical protein
LFGVLFLFLPLLKMVALRQIGIWLHANPPSGATPEGYGATPEASGATPHEGLIPDSPGLIRDLSGIYPG